MRRLARPAEDDPAVIVLSSGTTSMPKGVVHTHRSFIENARTNLYLYQGLSPRDRSLVPLSTAFIGCYNGWFPFLNAGACTIFMEHFDLGELAKRVADERATHVFLTPTLWRRLLNADEHNGDFRSVRLIGFAAEPMDATTLKRLREKISRNVVQMYGSTETGAAASCITAEEMVGERLGQRRPAIAQRRSAHRRAWRRSARGSRGRRDRRNFDLQPFARRRHLARSRSHRRQFRRPTATGAGGARAISAASMLAATFISKAGATI